MILSLPPQPHSMLCSLQEMGDAYSSSFKENSANYKLVTHHLTQIDTPSCPFPGSLSSPQLHRLEQPSRDGSHHPEGLLQCPGCWPISGEQSRLGFCPLKGTALEEKIKQQGKPHEEEHIC